MSTFLRRLSALATVCMLSLAGCTTPPPSPAASSSGPAADSDTVQTPATPKIRVTATSYPIAWVAEQIGGEYATVSMATPAGVDPLLYAYTPEELAQLGEASDVLFYVAGFQPALDENLAQVSTPAVDLAPHVQLVHHRALAGNHGDESGEAGRQLDPYFWHDTERLTRLAGAVREALSNMDPAHATEYAQALDSLTGKLNELDAHYAAGLAQCATRTVVTYRPAYAYMTDRYHLQQVAVQAMDPAITPTAKDIRNVKLEINANHVGTVFTEGGNSEAIAQLAGETGTQVASLDSLSTPPAEGDYLSGMEENLQSLRAGLGCQ
ncbi:metal ABC transporter substrate-binding protein [Actinobaculum suis]|uniref:Metal ABC transporter substrate-binding protein n=2 Tax=Actinobaculum suis TaxID=1657 RepID=A0AAW9HS34_9ACTO|nr:metal ABC transporter substrate-binding protein [Actinobaculum suis]MDY5153863.1 metal ABC transporter substrate-binding protein [Actinobaculum suis]